MPSSPELAAAREWASSRLSAVIAAIVMVYDSAVSPSPEALITAATSTLSILTFMSPLTRAVVLSVPPFSQLLSSATKLLSLLPLNSQATALAALLRLLFQPAAPFLTVPGEEQRSMCDSSLKPYVGAIVSPAEGGGSSLFPHVREPAIAALWQATILPWSSP